MNREITRSETLDQLTNRVRANDVNCDGEKERGSIKREEEEGEDRRVFCGAREMLAAE